MEVVMKNKMAILVTVASLAALAGCDRPPTAPAQPQSSAGPMERAGQRMDNAADQAKVKAAEAGKAIDDAAITAAVKAGLLAEPGLKVLLIDVDTREGQVTLTGSADSAANVRKAEQIAGNVQGVKSVDNRLAVSSKG
jgi:hyperosmotically inducible protein